jgi:hypothetical protein
VNDELAVFIAADHIVRTESTLVSLEQALLETIRPMFEETVGKIADRVSAIDERLSRLESK